MSRSSWESHGVFRIAHRHDVHRIELHTGAIVVHPNWEEVHVDIAESLGFSDGAWNVWRPGEYSFEGLVGE